MALNFKDVAEILKIVDASDCEEVILEVEGTRLVVRKGQIAGLGGGVASTSSVGASTLAAPASPGDCELVFRITGLLSVWYTCGRRESPRGAGSQRI